MEQEIAKRGITISLDTVTNDMVKQFTGKDYQHLVQQDYLGNPQASGQVVGTFITPDHKAALIMVKDGEIATLSIPDHKEIARGTLRSLIRTAGITVEEFCEQI